MTTNLTHSSVSLLRTGMFVRFPWDDQDRDDDNFRDYRIGWIDSVDVDAAIACVSFYYLDHDSETNAIRPVLQSAEFALMHLERCRILPDSEFTHEPSGMHGRILISCTDDWPDNACIDYYALLEGRTVRVSEQDIRVISTRQDSDPAHQILRYELQHPRWRSLRDHLVESYSELHDATYGIEDLVGSRVALLAHQAEVVAKVLSSTDCRYMLADEVGLGKTIEACVILKGLRRRYPLLKTLIVAPASLVRQWQNELTSKFWLDFVVACPGERISFPSDCPGVIISHEHLARHAVYWDWLQSRTWGLLIVDEAHQLWKNPSLFERIRTLSARTPRALILTATPIQRRAEEYLALLQVLDPDRYSAVTLDMFRDLLEAQDLIRRKVAYLQPTLTPNAFDQEEFEEDVGEIIEELDQDFILAALFEHFKEHTAYPNDTLDRACKVIAYISENYRIENRTIRNRRASISTTLPARELEEHYSYEPSLEETVALEELYDYVEHYLQTSIAQPLAPEYVRVLLFAAASSPHVLLDLLRRRATWVAQTGDKPASGVNVSDLLQPATPREELDRVYRLMLAAPSFSWESEELDRIIRRVEYWYEKTEQALAQLRRQTLEEPHHHRLVQVISAIARRILTDTTSKVLVFTAWTGTIEALLPHLQRFFGRETIVQFSSLIDEAALQEAANQFQADEYCRVMLCDELGGEGRNFQIATEIIHVDLPWTPAQIEQRIGRVDRLGRSGTVTSIVPFGRGTLEHDLFQIWQKAFSLFTQSLSGLEIALEETQTDLIAALQRSIRHGLADLLDPMCCKAAELRESVEEERYFEEGAINKRLREQFTMISERYRDGRRLAESVIAWAEIAGLNPSCGADNTIVTFSPKHFNLKSLSNAKYTPPNMEEALQRSQNRNTLVVRGTFNRDIAVRREDLVFFAPGDDPWTDSLIANAIEADRGRCCAIQHQTSESGLTWRGFDIFFSIQVNPRPLFAEGFDPTHLLQAQGFLATPTIRLLIGIDGAIIRRSNPIWQFVQKHFFNKKAGDTHLGQREGTPSPLDEFRTRYPEDEWQGLVHDTLTTAYRFLEQELEFTEELAAEAEEEFRRRIAGLEAAQCWMAAHSHLHAHSGTIIDEQRRAYAALQEGIQRPLLRLESICFWEIQEP